MNNYLEMSNNFRNFGAWIGGSCKPSEKGMLTAFPRFYICQHNVKNVSYMLKFEELPEINSPRWLSLEDLPGEVWKSVEGYEKLLSVSAYGRVKRLEHFRTYKDGRVQRYKEIIFRPAIKVGAYLALNINTGEKVEFFSVHRLVAKAFIPNPYNLPIVNHKDENPSNNVVSIYDDGTIDKKNTNLEWCDALYNSTYGTCLERKKRISILNGITRRVSLYTYNGELIKEYDSINDVKRELGLSTCAISLCCNNKSNTALGLHLRYSMDKYKKREICNKNDISIIINGCERLLSSLNLDEAMENINAIRECVYRNGIAYKKNNSVKVINVTDIHSLIRVNNKRKIIFVYLKPNTFDKRR